MTEIRLPLPPYAYRFDLLLEFIKRIAYPARLAVLGDTIWRFTGGHLLSYRQSADAIIVRGEGISAERESRIAQTSRRWLGLGNDLTAFYDLAQSDKELWRVVEPLVGLPIFCTETVFEALITLIIEQHIAWKSALRSQRSLMQLVGCSATVGEVEVYDFPSPAQLAQATRVQLKPLKITNKRIDLIIELADAVHRSELDLEKIRSLPPKQAYDKLLALKGIGPWTAGNVIGRALGSYPYVSHNDVALQAAVNHYFYENEAKKSAEQVVETLKPFGEFAGLAGHFVLLRWVLDRYPLVAI